MYCLQEAHECPHLLLISKLLQYCASHSQCNSIMTIVLGIPQIIFWHVYKLRSRTVRTKFLTCQNMCRTTLKKVTNGSFLWETLNGTFIYDYIKILPAYISILITSEILMFEWIFWKLKNKSLNDKLKNRAFSRKFVSR